MSEPKTKKPIKEEPKEHEDKIKEEINEAMKLEKIEEVEIEEENEEDKKKRRIRGELLLQPRNKIFEGANWRADGRRGGWRSRERGGWRSQERGDLGSQECREWYRGGRGGSQGYRHDRGRSRGYRQF